MAIHPPLGYSAVQPRLACVATPQYTVPPVDGTLTQGGGGLNSTKHTNNLYVEPLAANRFPGQKKRRPRRSSCPLSFQSSINFKIFL